MPEHRFVYHDLVQFSDTDMAGIVHFANYFRYVERAEHAFYRSLGLGIVERRGGHVPDEERVGWPRVHASANYLAPLHFEDKVEVELLLQEIRTRSLKYLFRVRKQDGTLAAEGHMATACVRKDPATGKMRSVEIPERIRSKIEVAPEDLLKRPVSK